MSERAKTHSCALTAVRHFERLRKLPNLFILMTILVSFDFAVDPCYEYKNLSHRKKKAVTILPIMEGGVIQNSMDGIVLREQQEQKCQQHVCQHTGVVQPSLAG